MTDHLPGRHTVNEEVRTLAKRLFDAVDTTLKPSASYRRLFEEAIAAVIESRRELAAARQRIARLERLTVTDEVTGALNRRGFNAALDAALARVRRTGETGLLLIVDLDGFKQINDVNGHQAGDLILASVATVLKRHTRETDSVARIGGDEFAVLLTDTDPDLANRRVETLESMLNGIAVPWEGRTIRVRASIGAVSYAADDVPDHVVQRADAKMYDAKRSRTYETAAPVSLPA